ncbi:MULTISPECIES: hypothetical protein [Brevibacillus]|uniref:hypothetical protein n=1 Tax=Brevibacillus TaxID=55080 RepID=UPI0007AC2742|nr:MULTISPECIES: hypothetical protein [Brevibacillus]KZE52202.1 hypothetical protein AV540_10005 [Brevibacillus parabrevis]HBZ79259.1 hypothetical protein [Brevibacillus sp.]
MGTGPCVQYGNHKMYTKGFAHLKDEKTEELVAHSWQYYKCKCGDYFTCVGRPEIGGRIGEYIPSEYINGIGVDDTFAVFYINPKRIRTTNASTLEGYRFYKS